MKKVFLLSLSLLFFISCVNDTIMNENEGTTIDESSLTRAGNKINICHKGRIINISVNALSGHQGHGDAVDMDSDGYFDRENDCSETDCDDTNASVNPAMTEVCNNEIDDNCNGEIDENCGLPAVVGDLRVGGVVFWVDPTDNTHGLVCALEDYATRIQWGCAGIDFPSVPNVTVGDPVGLGAEIGEGMANTNGILATTDCPSAAAALAARSFGSDWFLPSILELNEMIENKLILEAVPGFSAFQDVNGLYWSSTEYDDDSAWVVIESFGILSLAPKGDDSWIVRAVRAF